MKQKGTKPMRGNQAQKSMSWLCLMKVRIISAH